MDQIRIGPALAGTVQTVPCRNTERNREVPSFSEILNGRMEETDGIKFSKHAATRLESRSIELDRGDMRKLSDAISTASEKGVKDSLVLLGDVAYIVNVPDKTVVTAMPVAEAGANVFTNIDGAVIA